jgi:membrane protease YdiL (CAAX protease family)
MVIPAAIIFYIVMGLLSFALAGFFNISLWHLSSHTPGMSSYAVVLWGAITGLVIVALSRFLERFRFFLKLSDTLKQLLPNMRFFSVILLAVFSSLGEEMFFRGALLPLIGIHLSSFIFGFLHYRGKRPFLIWGLIAWGIGYLFSGLMIFTGSLTAPVLAHFTTNYFNLLYLSKKKIDVVDLS